MWFEHPITAAYISVISSQKLDLFLPNLESILIGGILLAYPER
jgi:hypothetical protein